MNPIFKNHVLCFYKGTAIPCIKIAFPVILRAIKSEEDKINAEISTQDILDQLNEMEQMIVKECNGKNLTSKILEKVAEKMSMDVPTFTIKWVWDLAVLIQRKVIQNDEMNGWLGINVIKDKNNNPVKIIQFG